MNSISDISAEPSRLIINNSKSNTNNNNTTTTNNNNNNNKSNTTNNKTKNKRKSIPQKIKHRINQKQKHSSQIFEIKKKHRSLASIINAKEGTRLKEFLNLHVTEHPSPWNVSLTAVATSGTLVRPEEAGILVVVLALWIAAIALFINRWGKIRMLEPYHPYFEPSLQEDSFNDPRGSIIKEMIQRPSRVSLCYPPPTHRSSLGTSGCLPLCSPPSQRRASLSVGATQFQIGRSQDLMSGRRKSTAIPGSQDLAMGRRQSSALHSRAVLSPSRRPSLSLLTDRLMQESRRSSCVSRLQMSPPAKENGRKLGRIEGRSEGSMMDIDECEESLTPSIRSDQSKKEPFVSQI